ncbi:MAG: hypothetical protein JW982_15785 [Spirochaetes bacterium]|nr:hypothetical protein [Spirochaetota bacterium]
MKKLVQLSKKISDSYFVTAAVLLVLSAAFVISDHVFNLTAGFDSGFIYSAAKNSGGIGILVLLTAFCFYPFRRMFLYLKKKNRLSGNEFIPRVVVIWSNLHPVLAAVGIVMVFMHGYVFLKVVYEYQFMLFTLMGFISLLALLVLISSGTMIKKKMQNSKLRKFHRIFVIVFFMFFILHRAIIMLNL